MPHSIPLLSCNPAVSLQQEGLHCSCSIRSFRHGTQSCNCKQIILFLPSQYKQSYFIALLCWLVHAAILKVWGEDGISFLFLDLVENSTLITIRDDVIFKVFVDSHVSNLFTDGKNAKICYSITF